MLNFAWFFQCKLGPGGSGWDHFGHMLRSCGVSVVAWGTLGALGGRSWTTKGAWRAPSSAKGGQGEPEVEISGVKRGHEGPRGLMRADEG